MTDKNIFSIFPEPIIINNETLTGIHAMITHITAVLSTLLIYLLLGLSCLGWGRVASFVLGLSEDRPALSLMPVWLGWAVTLLIFQILHLFLPVTAGITIPVLSAGLVFSPAPVRNAIRVFREKQVSRAVLMISLLIFIAIAVLVASRAMMPPGFYDTGLYHLNAIRWINSYPIVPGLGNLHGRLAYNNSFFTFVAALNFYPFFGHGRSLANSFLLLLSLATLLPSLITIIRRPAVLINEHPFKYAAVLFLTPVFLYLTQSEFGLTDPTPDYTSLLLQLVMFLILVQSIALWLEGERNLRYPAAVLAVLAATAVTVKLSNLAFSAVILCFVAAYQWQTRRVQMKNHLLVLCFVILLISIWFIRGFILSGVLLYPSTIGYGWFSVDWAVPIGKIIDEANTIYAFARRPHVPWQEVLGNRAWLAPWFQTILRDNTNVVYPAVFATVFCILALAVSRLKKNRRPGGLEWSILLCSPVSLVYWFLTAPDPRFAGAAFFLFMISAILLFLIAVRNIAGKRIFILVLCVVFCGCNADLFSYIVRHARNLQSVSTVGWHPVQQAPLDKKTTLSGLVVYVPVNRNADDRCWDSPLPSTPHFNERLRLRRPADISSGFTVLPPDGNPSATDK